MFVLLEEKPPERVGWWERLKGYFKKPWTIDLCPTHFDDICYLKITMRLPPTAGEGRRERAWTQALEEARRAGAESSFWHKDDRLNQIAARSGLMPTRSRAFEKNLFLKVARLYQAHSLKPSVSCMVWDPELTEAEPRFYEKLSKTCSVIRLVTDKERDAAQFAEKLLEKYGVPLCAGSGEELGPADLLLLFDKNGPVLPGRTIVYPVGYAPAERPGEVLIDDCFFTVSPEAYEQIPKSMRQIDYFGALWEAEQELAFDGLSIYALARRGGRWLPNVQG